MPFSLAGEEVGDVVSLVVLERQNCSFSGEGLSLTLTEKMYYFIILNLLWTDKAGKVLVYL